MKDEYYCDVTKLNNVDDTDSRVYIASDIEKTFAKVDELDDITASKIAIKVMFDMEDFWTEKQWAEQLELCLYEPWVFLSRVIKGILQYK